MFNILGCFACCRPSRMWITFNRFSATFVLHFYLCCTHCIVPKSLLNYLNSFCEGTFKLNAKFDAHSLFYSLTHFECVSHTVHVLTQLPPLTSTVKSSLFTHAHSSPLSQVAGLHQCHANCSHYINNGWIFQDRPHVQA